MGSLLLLFIVLPAVELGLLIEVGQRIGTFETIMLIVVTGVVGASMARNQGVRVLGHVQSEIAAGRMPADSLVDGILILLASALLVTPGVLTDAFGFLCLIPAFRGRVKREAMRRFAKAVAENRVHVNVATSGFSGDPGAEENLFEAMGGLPRRDASMGTGPIVDVTPQDREEDRDS